ncbi:MAG: PAS domain S-box protein [Deltaproteobacteria bacterium]|nr:PAS domain S-box protein [Deltaproteobacteria bacterium]MBT4263223.1 PAS domain S-box protein [Deltaproteobacteria bacterium]MBT6500539.1 PAS domain S-box protein [Deltaproteobacteria bacterium]MBT7150876.1 PAS domain S-box protein [Deltaproteobacteria bacterium]MBT7710181.1 PAS domain S-box protein [Deltaproteobacteria bacterium]
MQHINKSDLLNDLEKTIAEREGRLGEIKAQEEWYRLLFNNGNDAIFVYFPTMEGHPNQFIEVNDVACERLGYTREELLLMSPLDLVANQQQLQISTDMQRLLIEKTLITETVYRTKVGSQIPVEVSGHLFDLRGKRAVITFVRDITIRKDATTALAESENVLRTLINSSFDGAVLITIEGTILVINESAATFFNRDVAELIGQSFFHLLPPSKAEERKTFANKVLETGQPFKYESHNEGQILEVSINPVKSSLGKISKLAIFARNITRQRQIENELVRASDEMERRVEQRTFELVQVNEELKREIKERKRTAKKLKVAQEKSELANAAKSEFLANISHELRNPLQQMLSLSQLGVDKINDVNLDELLHYFSQIQKSGSQLLLLLNDLLDLSKLESGHIEYSIQLNDVFQIVNEAIIELGPTLEEKNIRLTIAEPEIPTSVYCDVYKIGQVIRNLLSNAVRYSPRGKNISIQYQKTQSIIMDNQVSALQFSVSDQGLGIPEDEKAHLFDKFVQSNKTRTSNGGTGLGLAICKEIVTAHQGKIWAENNPESGATFFMILPYRFQNF